MARTSNYPGALDSLVKPDTSDTQLSTPGVHLPDILAQHAAAIEAIQAELGLDPAGVSTTVAARASIDFLTSGAGGELVATVPVPTAKDTDLYRVIYSVQVPSILTGDLLVCSYNFELTNDLGVNVGAWNYLILGDLATSTTGLVSINDVNGFNVTPNMHHAVYARTGMMLAAADYTNEFVNVVAYCAAAAATYPSDTVDVESPYGRLDIAHFRT